MSNLIDPLTTRRPVASSRPHTHARLTPRIDNKRLSLSTHTSPHKPTRQSPFTTSSIAMHFRHTDRRIVQPNHSSRTSLPHLAAPTRAEPRRTHHQPTRGLTDPHITNPCLTPSNLASPTSASPPPNQKKTHLILPSHTSHLQLKHHQPTHTSHPTDPYIVPPTRILKVVSNFPTRS